MKARTLAVALILGTSFALPLVAAAQGDAAKGAALYTSNKCGTCHTAPGITGGNAKGPLEGVGSKYTADELRQWLVDPAAMTAKTKAARKPPMKSYKHLPKEELDALVAWMQTLKKK